MFWLCRQTTHGNRDLFQTLANQRHGVFHDEIPVALHEQLSESHLFQISQTFRHAMTFEDRGLQFTIFEAEVPTSSEAMPIVFTVFCVTGFERTMPDFLWRPGKPNDSSKLARFLGNAKPATKLEAIPMKSVTSALLFGNDVQALRGLLSPPVRERLSKSDLHLEATRSHLLCYQQYQQVSPTPENIAARIVDFHQLFEEMGLQNTTA